MNPSRQTPLEVFESLRQVLLAEASLTLNFLVLTVSACVIATLGLLTNSVAVIIGAMIVAPLMMPLRGLALAALEADGLLLRQSLKTLGVGSLVSILISGFIGGIFSLPPESFGSEILARTRPNLADLGIAIAAGVVSAFAKLRPQISDALAGTAIAVALMPPLCVVGIALSQTDWGASGGALVLYLTNFLGITLACMLVFVWGGYSLDRRHSRRALGGVLMMTSLLIIPLFISLLNLIGQARLKATIITILRQETITVGQQAELINLEVDWNLLPWSQQPSTVLITVRAEHPITPKQVGYVERLLSQRLNRPLKLIVRVSQVTEVKSDRE